jgi:hypothetical protein
MTQGRGPGAAVLRETIRDDWGKARGGAPPIHLQPPPTSLIHFLNISILDLSEYLIDLIPHMLTLRRLQIPHRTFQIGVTEPSLDGTQINVGPQ